MTNTAAPGVSRPSTPASRRSSDDPVTPTSGQDRGDCPWEDGGGRVTGARYWVCLPGVGDGCVTTPSSNNVMMDTTRPQRPDHDPTTTRPRPDHDTTTHHDPTTT
ncbi:hypothetical protein Hamer_G004977 [Homarus americanus]|uniref:Uncharacterized protein n=1 Tax=Homarus americanus TaxID=6706 RepID=A0A8J5JUV5_HOMAM|nr:hypothetical protein Hamer_G004977 [Homarus americanus]